MTTAKGEHGPTRGWLRQIWESGGRGERAVLLAWFLGLSFMPLLLLFMVLVPSSTFPPEAWHQIGIGIILAGVPIALVYPAILDALHTAQYLRTSLERSDSVTPLEKEYLLEWARTKEVLGVNGQFSDSVLIGLVYTVLYFGLLFAAIPYVLLLYPYLGIWTAPTYAAFVIPTYVAIFVFNIRRSRRLYREASARGLRLEELRDQMAPRRRTD